jgi:hypothetical protein
LKPPSPGSVADPGLLCHRVDVGVDGLLVERVDFGCPGGADLGGERVQLGQGPTG